MTESERQLGGVLQYGHAGRDHRSHVVQQEECIIDDAGVDTREEANHLGHPVGGRDQFGSAPTYGSSNSFSLGYMQFLRPAPEEPLRVTLASTTSLTVGLRGEYAGSPHRSEGDHFPVSV